MSQPASNFIFVLLSSQSLVLVVLVLVGFEKVQALLDALETILGHRACMTVISCDHISVYVGIQYVQFVTESDNMISVTDTCHY